MKVRNFILMSIAVAALGPGLHAQQRAAAGSRSSFATSQDAVRYYENLVGRLAQQVRSMQDENAMLSASNADLKQRTARLENDVRALSGEIAALRKQIAADAEARKSQLNQLADKLSRPSRTEGAKPSAGPVPPEKEAPAEFVEHVVEKGTTLNALAKAYHVPVKEIMAANKMKKPVLYAGQKLLIPVAKKP